MCNWTLTIRLKWIHWMAVQSHGLWHHYLLQSYRLYEREKTVLKIKARSPNWIRWDINVPLYPSYNNHNHQKRTGLNPALIHPRRLYTCRLFCIIYLSGGCERKCLDSCLLYFEHKKTVPIFCVVVMTVLRVDWRWLMITELSGYKCHVYLKIYVLFVPRYCIMVHLRWLPSREWWPSLCRQ